MKTIVKCLFFAACLSLAISCSKNEEFLGENANMLKKGHVLENTPALGLDQERYVTMNSMNLKVHYRIIGKGPVDMVFIPGWTNPLTVYTKQFDYFRDKARCIYVDLPGHGLSDAPENTKYTMGLMADAVYDVVKKEGVKEFVAVGFSWGPVIWGQFYLKHPGMMQKLVNLDGGFTVWPPVGDPAREEMIAAIENDYEAMKTWDLATKQFLLDMLIPPSSAPEDLQEWGKYFLVMPSSLMADVVHYYGLEDVNQPPGWTMPIMSIYSSEHTDMNYEQLYFPNAEIHVLPGGHVIQWEHADAVNKLIDDFLPDRPGKKY